MEKIPYVKYLRAISNGDALFYVMDDPMKSGVWLFVQLITVEDVTTNFDNIRIGRGQDQHNIFWWEDTPVPGAGVLYDFEPLFFVPELDRVIVRFDGTTEADLLNVWINGYTTGKRIPGGPQRTRKRGE